MIPMISSGLNITLPSLFSFGCASLTCTTTIITHIYVMFQVGKPLNSSFFIQAPPHTKKLHRHTQLRSNQLHPGIKNTLRKLILHRRHQQPRRKPVSLQLLPTASWSRMPQPHMRKLMRQGATSSDIIHAVTHADPVTVRHPRPFGPTFMPHDGDASRFG